MTTTARTPGVNAPGAGLAADHGSCQAHPTTTRSRTMLLLHEELARAQCQARHEDLAQSMRLARMASARRRQRRLAAARRRVQLSLAAAR